MKNLTTLKNMMAAIHPDVTTVSCKFRGKSVDKQEYTFKITRTLAEQCAEDDYLLVTTKYGPALVQVVAVHDNSQVDTEAPFLYQWAFQKLDMAEDERLTEAENAFAEELDRKQKEEARLVLAEQLGISLTSLPALEVDNTVVDK